MEQKDVSATLLSQRNVLVGWWEGERRSVKTFGG